MGGSRISKSEFMAIALPEVGNAAEAERLFEALDLHQKDNDALDQGDLLLIGQRLREKGADPVMAAGLALLSKAIANKIQGDRNAPIAARMTETVLRLERKADDPTTQAALKALNPLLQGHRARALATSAETTVAAVLVINNKLEAGVGLDQQECTLLHHLADTLPSPAIGRVAAREDRARVQAQGEPDGNRGNLSPAEQLERFGITTRQYERAYHATLSRQMFEHIRPEGYDHVIDAVEVRLGIETSALNTMLLDQGSAVNQKWHHRRLDAFALYLGLPQIHNTFALASFRPSRSNDANEEYLRFADPVVEDRILAWGVAMLPSKDGQDHKVIVDFPDSEAGSAGGVRGAGIMHMFTVSRGKDAHGSYISYYDLWDLHPMAVGGEASKAGVGHPLSIYNRIYFDPSTGKRLSPQP